MCRLSDEVFEDAQYAIQALQCFADIELEAEAGMPRRSSSRTSSFRLFPLKKLVGSRGAGLGSTRQSRAADPESVARFQETITLRSLAATTQAEYLWFIRKRFARHGVIRPRWKKRRCGRTCCT